MATRTIAEAEQKGLDFVWGSFGHPDYEAPSAAEIMASTLLVRLSWLSYISITSR
jgi:hypothetical protein